jgi:glyoxylase-like metal-dependent hydrolase (beta-lactamase superfamily II)
VPIPDNPLGYTLVYLIESTAGPVLIDAGWDHPSSWRSLTEGLKFAGTNVADVYGVLVTHHHPDHAGLAHRVRESSGAWVALHPADADIIRRMHGEASPGGPERRLARLREVLLSSGAPEDEVAALRAWPAGMPRLWAAPDRPIGDGDLVDVPGRRVRAVWTPGHSPGHTCFYLEDERRLLSGDHLLPVITPHVALYVAQDGDPLGDFLGSLRRLSELDIAEVLPAHEFRFTAAADRAAQIAAHHQARLDEVRVALRPHGATAWDVARAMQWNQPWDDMSVNSHRMALAEAAAHLRFLQRRHEIRAADGEPPIRFVTDPNT